MIQWVSLYKKKNLKKGRDKNTDKGGHNHLLTHFSLKHCGHWMSESAYKEEREK